MRKKLKQLVLIAGPWLGIFAVGLVFSCSDKKEAGQDSKTSADVSVERNLQFGPKIDDTLFALWSNDPATRANAVTKIGKDRGAQALENLIVALEDQEYTVRVAAVAALVDLGDPLAVPALLAKSGHPDHKFVVTTILALGHFDDPQTVGPLIHHLSSQHAEIEAAAKESLKAMPKLAAPALIPLLVANEPAKGRSRGNAIRLRRNAIRLLGELDEPSAARPLIKLLLDEKNPAVQGLAERALMTITGEDVVADLLDVLNRPERLPDMLEDMRHRRSAVTILSQREPPEIEALMVSLKSLAQEEVAKALGDLGDKRAVEPLISTILPINRVWPRKAPFVEALGKIGDPRAIPTLAALLSTSSRGVAALALGKIGAQESIPDIVKYLNRWDSRLAVSTALRQLGWIPKADEEFVYSLVGQDDWNGLRAEIMWPIAKRVLLQDLDSPEKEDFQFATFSLIALSVDEVIPKLVEKLNTRGNKRLATIFLNSGNKALAKGASEWAAKHGYMINTVSGSIRGITWQKP